MRNTYNALTAVPTWVTDLCHEAEAHNCWTTGIASDKKQRGTAINCDVYGYCATRQLAVVQVRQAIFNPKRFTRVRKDYYLIGHNEDGSFFAHAIESPARSSKAMTTPEGCVDYVLAKIWDCRVQDLDDILRQGDIAFVPVSKLPETAQPVEAPVVIRDTHVLNGDIWRDRTGTHYTRRGAVLKHAKNQHKAIRAKGGYYRVQEGYRAEVWGFSAPTAD